MKAMIIQLVSSNDGVPESAINRAAEKLRECQEGGGLCAWLSLGGASFEIQALALRGVDTSDMLFSLPSDRVEAVKITRALRKGGVGCVIVVISALFPKPSEEELMEITQST